MDWDSAYREQARFEGPPPWNIGEPQPELAALVAAGKFRSDVLDAGCGYAELSLALAADGYTVVGVDLTPTAVAAANRAAQERGLSKASFVQADITRSPATTAGSTRGWIAPCLIVRDAEKRQCPTCVSVDETCRTS
jgi:SAM-dependent methyltransferase